MKRTLAALLMALMIGPLAATSVLANPFPKGNAAAGKKLHDAKCAQCHNTMFPDKDGTQLYSDLFRKMENPRALQGMVQVCATRSNAGWFDEEILNVTRYLNDTYYQFK